MLSEKKEKVKVKSPKFAVDFSEIEFFKSVHFDMVKSIG
jgi:hypothetical protein